MKVNLEILDKYVEDGLVKYQVDKDLRVYSYTDKVQFDKAWDKYTRMCRGLVVDKDGNVVCKTLEKFFNLNENETTKLENLPDEPYRITEKLDGCFMASTVISLWDGTTISIRDLVRSNEHPLLVGATELGEFVPSKLIAVKDNGLKDDWLRLKIYPTNPDSVIANRRNSSSIYTTPNHKFRTCFGYTQASDLEVGSIVYSYEDYIDDQYEFLINSSLLGDGSVCKTGKSFRHQFGHKKEHQDYTFYKASLMPGTVTREVVSGYGSLMVQASSPTMKALRKLRKSWYPEDKKIVPEDLGWIDDRAIAIWYMDDGSRIHSEGQQDRAAFHTQGFTLKDVKRLCNVLKVMYGVDAVTQKDSRGKGYSIRINSGDEFKIGKFWLHIAPFIHPIMRYKIPERYRKIDYQTIEPGKLKLQPVPCVVEEVISIKERPGCFPTDRRAYDLQTETVNYMAQGIWVHNSLIQLFYYEGSWRLCTRGSFDNEYIEFAQRSLPNVSRLPTNRVYACEVCLPPDLDGMRRAVTHEPGLYFLAAFDSFNSFKELNFERESEIWNSWGGKSAKVFEPSLQKIVDSIKSNTTTEGWVVHYPDSDLRVKIKTEWWLRVFRFISKLDEKHIKEFMAAYHGDDQAWLQTIPEELLPEALEIKQRLRGKMNQIRERCKLVYEQAPKETRKDFALFVLQDDYKHILFRMLDGKDIEESLLELA